MSKQKTAWDSQDTLWDDFHRKNGLMTNREFFSSNAQGGFYEGMDWDGNNWVPNAASRQREAEIEAEKCKECHCNPCACWE